MLPIHKSKFTVFNYDEIPAGYYYNAMKNGKTVQRFWHQFKFKEIAANIHEGASVLDIGCGPGSFLDILSTDKKELHAIGVDISSRQIDFAQNNIKPKNNSQTIKFIELKNEKLPFEDHQFDFITCIEVIEHIHPYYALNSMIEARRVLKKDGTLLISTPNYRSFWPFIEFLLEKLSPVKYHDQHINKFTPNAFCKFIEMCGFEVIELKTIFILSPFLSPLSWKCAEKIETIETKILPRLGSLLLIKAKPISL